MLRLLLRRARLLPYLSAGSPGVNRTAAASFDGAALRGSSLPAGPLQTFRGKIRR